MTFHNSRISGRYQARVTHSLSKARRKITDQNSSFVTQSRYLCVNNVIIENPSFGITPDLPLISVSVGVIILSFSHTPAHISLTSRCDGSNCLRTESSPPYVWFFKVSNYDFSGAIRRGLYSNKAWKPVFEATAQIISAHYSRKSTKLLLWV